MKQAYKQLLEEKYLESNKTIDCVSLKIHFRKTYFDITHSNSSAIKTFWKVLNLRQTKIMATLGLVENCSNYYVSMVNLMELSQ